MLLSVVGTEALIFRVSLVASRKYMIITEDFLEIMRETRSIFEVLVGWLNLKTWTEESTFDESIRGFLPHF